MGNFTFNLELNHKPKGDKHNVIIRITHNRKHKRVSTPFFVKKENLIYDQKLKYNKIKVGSKGEIRGSYMNKVIQDKITRSV